MCCWQVPLADAANERHNFNPSQYVDDDDHLVLGGPGWEKVLREATCAAIDANAYTGEPPDVLA